MAIAGPWMTVNNTQGQNEVRQIGYFTISFAALLSLRPWRYPQHVLLVPWPLILVLSWCWLSLTWAIYPAIGMRRLVLTSVVLWSIFTLTRKIGIERSIAILQISLGLSLAINYAAVFFDPALATEHGRSTTIVWRGVMGQKNLAGLVCAATVLAFAFCPGRLHPTVRGLMAASAAYFLVRTDSQTSMIMTVAALLMGGLFWWLSSRAGQRRLADPRWAWALLPLAIATFLYLQLNAADVIRDFQNDPAGFTGRTQIWAALVRAYADRPLLGIGYGSFWDVGPNGPIYRYASGWVVDQSEGHQGYLDLLVQIGAIGTLLALFAMLVWPLERLLRGGTHPARPLAAGLLVFCLGHSFSESGLLDRDSLSEVLMLIGIALLWNATTSFPEARPAKTSDAQRVRTPLKL